MLSSATINNSNHSNSTSSNINLNIEEDEDIEKENIEKLNKKIQNDFFGFEDLKEE